jgi:hypothetical protein
MKGLARFWLGPTALVVAAAIAVSLPAVATAERDANATETKAIMKSLRAPAAAANCLRLQVSTVNPRYGVVLFSYGCARFKRQAWYEFDYARGIGGWILSKVGSSWLESFPLVIGSVQAGCKNAAESEQITTAVARDLQVCLSA